MLGVVAEVRRELGPGVGAGPPNLSGDRVASAGAGEVAAGRCMTAAVPGAWAAGAPWEVSVITTTTTAATDSSAPADVATPARKLVSSSWV